MLTAHVLTRFAEKKPLFWCALVRSMFSEQIKFHLERVLASPNDTFLRHFKQKWSNTCRMKIVARNIFFQLCVLLKQQKKNQNQITTQHANHVVYITYKLPQNVKRVNEMSILYVWYAYSYDTIRVWYAKKC